MSDHGRKKGPENARGGPAPFDWDRDKEKAAQLVAEDELFDVEIARRCSIGERQLRRWKDHREFSERVKAIAQKLGETCLRRAIARRVDRVRLLDECSERLQQIIRERGADPLMETIPGGTTGLLVIRKAEVIMVASPVEGGPPVPRIMPLEVAVDVGLLRELREHARQAAQELGQWAEKHEHSGPDGGPLRMVVLTDEERRAAVLAILAAGGTGQGLELLDVPGGGPALGASRAGDAGGADAAGPLASEAAPLWGPADPAAVQPAGGQEPGQRRPGPSHGTIAGTGLDPLA